MSNPTLNDDVYRKAKEEELAGWAAPQGMPHGANAPQPPYSNAPGTAAFGPQGYPQAGYPQQAPYPPQGYPQQPGYPQQQGYPLQGYPPPPAKPSGRGWGAAPSPVSPWSATPDGYNAMRLSGVVSATGVLLCLLVAAAFFGWQAVTITNVAGTLTPSVPPLMLIGLLVGLGLSIGLRFKPRLAPVLGPVYALAEGYALGAISHYFEPVKSGLVAEAVFCTLAVFAVMLFLFAFRIIKVTQRMRSIVFAATGALMLVYLVDIVMSLFGSHLPVIDDATPLGIGFSVLVCILAAFFLLVQFDFVDRGIKMGAPRYMEWYSAFALLASIVFIYIEVLQLLAKLRGGRR